MKMFALWYRYEIGLPWQFIGVQSDQPGLDKEGRIKSVEIDIPEPKETYGFPQGPDIVCERV